MLQLLYATPEFTVQYDVAHNWLIVTWLGLQPTPIARAYCAQILTCIQATGSTKMLNDGSQDEGGWQELASWVAQIFLPQLAAAGVVAVAWVSPHSLRAHVTMNEVLAAATSANPNVAAFVELEEAYAWLCKTTKVAEQKT